MVESKLEKGLFTNHFLNFFSKSFVLKPFILFREDMTFLDFPFGDNTAPRPKIALFV